MSSAFYVGKGPIENKRLVFAFQKSNELILAPPYSVHNVNHCPEKLDRIKNYAIVDVKSAFHHLILDLASQGLTAFYCNGHTYVWKVLPFGINSAPAYWSLYVDHVLRDLRNIYLHYFDDILVKGETL